ncbi:hypothetical protein OOT33_07065 [Sphingobium sp. DEHP117]|uniref:hypothetical protein n=1 Tax=Sphingobium sp. DEHP117 TaxID=2993436 RepID=UPI0027D626FB|nr:hypothetical protein [Sphingobium sp. DEHP117]MDQ4420192.1 hypothetical protein [Sphingobium sp. DEHP117]
MVLRSGEIRNLKIEDIDWRTESIRILHTKTRACSYLPLMAPVGEAILKLSALGTTADRRPRSVRADPCTLWKAPGAA